MSKGEIFLQTCNAILLLRGVYIRMFDMLRIQLLANCDGNMYLPILHLPRVELHCKLQEKLHRVIP